MSVWNDPCLFSPSLICLDFCRLEEQVHALEAAGIPLLHIDILDGHFSPSMPLGFEAVRQLRSKTSLPFDAHVMTSTPDYFVRELLDIGVQQICVHAETAPHLDGMLNTIRAGGARAGVALKPSTPLSVLEYVLEKCDTVLLMLINPGYASSAAEAQVPYAARKIADLRRMISERGLSTKIEVDGRISQKNIRQYGGGAVDIFVTGSTCLNKQNLPGDTSRLMDLRQTVIAQPQEAP